MKKLCFALLSLPLALQAGVFDAINVDVSATEAGLTAMAGIDVLALNSPSKSPFDLLEEQNAIEEARKATGSSATGSFIDPAPEPRNIFGHLSDFAHHRPFVATACAVGAAALAGYGTYEGGKAAGWWGDSGGGGGDDDSEPAKTGSESSSSSTEGDSSTVQFGDNNHIEGDVVITIGRTTSSDSSSQSDSQNASTDYNL